MTAKKPGSMFGTFLPYQERNADALFGRADDVARLERLLTGEAHLAVVAGPSGDQGTYANSGGATRSGSRPHPEINAEDDHRTAWDTTHDRGR